MTRTITHPVQPVDTARLRLLPLTADVADAILRNRQEAEKAIHAHIPKEWPTDDLGGFLPFYVKTLQSDPTRLGWELWLMVHRDMQVVVGDLGFKGKPDANGVVEIGYGVLPAHQRQGYATEATQALVRWAFAQNGVRRVTAACMQNNPASRRVLEKTGMQFTHESSGLLFWEIHNRQAAIVRLNHVQITIPPGTENNARAFYCNLLGLKEIPKPEALRSRGGFWLQLGFVQVHIGVEDGVDRSATRAHIAYEVDDLEIWRTRLQMNGVTINDSVPIPGFSRFEIRDPFDNRIEFIQPA